MLVADHLWRADRLAASATRAEGAGDGILAIWGYMHAATHALNTLLHQEHVTAESDSCASNHAGQYLDRAGRRVSAFDSRGPVGDLIHTDMPAIEYPTSPQLAAAVKLLAAVEASAARALRSDWTPAPSDVAAARSAYRALAEWLADRRGELP